MIRKLYKELLTYLCAALIIWLCISLISESENIIQGIILSINRCINVIIPSLFAFMALSGIIISTRLYNYISKPFYPLTKFVLHMPNQLFFVFLLGNVSGYPVGVKLLTQLKIQNKINSKTAEIMSCFCYGGGPAFYIGAVGLTAFGNKSIGMIIFLSTVIANTIIAFVLCRIFKLECCDEDCKITITSDCIIDSIDSAGKSLFTICITIIFFSVVMSVLETKGLFSFLLSKGVTYGWCTILKSILEISNLSDLKGNAFSYIPLAAGACSLGGLCVILQVKTLVGNCFSLKPFMISRIVSAIFSAIVCRILCKMFLSEVIYTSVQPELIIETHNLIPSLCLVGMILIIIVGKKKKAVTQISETAFNSKL